MTQPEMELLESRLSGTIAESWKDFRRRVLAPKAPLDAEAYFGALIAFYSGVSVGFCKAGSADVRSEVVGFLLAMREHADRQLRTTRGSGTVQ